MALDDAADLLTQARARAARLVETLLAQQQELAVPSSTVPPQTLQAGRAALESVLAAARRVLERLDDAGVDAYE